MQHCYITIVTAFHFTVSFSASSSFSLHHSQAAEQMVKLYQLFIDHDATMVEVNPLVITGDDKGEIITNPSSTLATHMYNVYMCSNHVFTVNTV